MVKEYGANVDIKNADGYSARDLAERENYELIKRYLEVKSSTKKTKRKSKIEAEMTRPEVYRSKMETIKENNEIVYRNKNSIRLEGLSMSRDRRTSLTSVFTDFGALSRSDSLIG